MRPINTHPVHNRIDAVMAHCQRYWFSGISRLAEDAGVTPGAISRLLSGDTSPSFCLVWSITKALERELGKPLNPMELVSVDGTYPTPSACSLVGCNRNCTPPRVYEGKDPETTGIGLCTSTQATEVAL